MKLGVIGRIFVVLALIFLIGCQRDEKVGTEGLLDLEESAAAARLGETLKSPDPEGTQEGALGASPSPEASPTETKPQEIIEVILTKDTPYYQPPNIVAPAGALLRFINKDDKVRHPFTQEGPYDFGDIAPGARGELVVSERGRWIMGDEKVPFATGNSLEVY